MLRYPHEQKGPVCWCVPNSGIACMTCREALRARARRKEVERAKPKKLARYKPSVQDIKEIPVNIWSDSD